MTPTRRIDFRRLEPGLSERFDILCLDTEFTRLPYPKEAVWSWAGQARVLSIGVAALDARSVPSTFYGVRDVDRLLRDLCTSFVLQQVLPALDAAPADIAAATNRDLVASTHRFLKSRRASSGKPPLFAVDWPGDAYLVEAISQQRYEWLLVENMASVAAALGADSPAALVRHNALHDAQAISAALMAITDM